MPFESRRAKLDLVQKDRELLTAIAGSRSESFGRVQRAQMLLGYAQGESISAIARKLDTNRPKIERHVAKALDLGVQVALCDLPREGKPRVITPEARAWITSLACQKPKDLGYSQELWTTRLLAKYIRKHSRTQGHPSVARLSAGTVSKILAQNPVKPHKISYYLERRDPNFDNKMVQVLHVYKEVQLMLRKASVPQEMSAFLSYDEKPGIQAIENSAPDLPPHPGTHPSFARDSEYIRHGTLSLLAGIDLLTGHIVANVEERHRSREFITFLKKVDDRYRDRQRIKIILDNHSAHISKETRNFLATKPNRFEFVFTPTHGSWLNLIEVFFSKLARNLLRGIRTKSKVELKERLLGYIEETNEAPVIFRWKYKLDTIQI
jgi:transposase